MATLLKLAGETVVRAHHDSLTAACAVRPSAKNARKFADTQGNRGEHWYGPETNGTADGTAALYRGGWIDGARRIAEMPVAVNVPPTSVRRRRVWADQGDTVDMPRVYAGNLDTAWQATRRQQRVTTRRVTIVTPISIMCNQSIDQLYPRGAAALKLADVLSEAGYSVAIVATVAVSNIEESGEALHLCHSIDIKAPDQHLDMATLAAIMAHPGFFRTAGFAMVCSAERKVCGSLGTKDHGNRLGRIVIDELIAQGDRVITIGQEVENEETANQWLNKQVAQFNESP
jgi:hypothetical protein